MNSFITHTLMMLEDMGMSIRYPDIRHVTFSDDGTSTVHMSFCCMTGNRVSIEHNQQMKFMMIFTVLDFFIDTKYPELEGLSFAQKYRQIPCDNDKELILRELYRVAKVIRNSIVHSPSSFDMSGNNLNVDYQFRSTDFSLKISFDALMYFYTSLVMFSKGDLGDGNYFLGIIRSLYSNVVSGIVCFSDEFGSQLNMPSDGLKIKPYVREIVMHPDYEVEDGQVKIKFNERNTPEWQGMDFYIEYNGVGILVPIEALRSDFTIGEQDLINNWRHSHPFPPLKKTSNNALQRTSS